MCAHQEARRTYSQRAFSSSSAKYSQRRTFSIHLSSCMPIRAIGRGGQEWKHNVQELRQQLPCAERALLMHARTLLVIDETNVMMRQGPVCQESQQYRIENPEIGVASKHYRSATACNQARPLATVTALIYPLLPTPRLWSSLSDRKPASSAPPCGVGPWPPCLPDQTAGPRATLATSAPATLPSTGGGTTSHGAP